MSIDSEDFLKQANAGAMNNSFGKNPNESHQSIASKNPNATMM